ncbi:Transcriptional regulator, AraC family [Sinorhizobium sojae CCBAU 05684]|uniref:Transcriptional regulator, AraC family n=1 Tax=Sinorhizobium sojae CCBAU 05684 TaxID=716928 RepID=A0A249PGX8_9HYPH|nr:AraC family transcriptional regulator [Sinorhizobium sojae]ASY64977.1 Transcriptional regulator, AraC family [Sinorhizobium sojae CCBAU 05684]
MNSNGAMAFDAGTLSADHMVELLSRHYSNIELKPHSAQLKLATAGLLGRIGELRYDFADTSGGFDIVPVEGEFALFTFPEAGGMLLETESGLWETGSSEAVASNGGHVRRYGFPGQRKHTNLAFQPEILQTRLSVLFETPVREPIEFATVVPSDAKRFASMTWLLQGLKNPEFASLDNMAAARSFSHLVQDMILEFWPHNHSHLFERRLATPSRRQVKAAINYIHEHAQEAPSTVEVAQASGVSLRTLQQAFRDATGKTILEYTRDVRLQRAKDDLLKHHDEPLAEIARRWGFSNVGRFSRQFFEAFGEMPSHMRRR